MTIQTQIPDLMADLKQQAGAAVILIAGLGVRAAGWGRACCRTVPVAAPSQVLLAAVPKLGSLLTSARTRLAEIRGAVRSLKQRIAGCVFASRCGYAKDICRQSATALEANRPRPIDNSCQRHRFAGCRHELPGTPAAHTFRGPSAAAAISRT